MDGDSNSVANQKKLIPNPEENWAIFKGVHEPIIDRETFELVQELVGKTKRRSTKEKNGEKNMFSDLLYCADCGSKLWYHVKQDKELANSLKSHRDAIEPVCRCGDFAPVSAYCHA